MVADCVSNLDDDTNTTFFPIVRSIHHKILLKTHAYIHPAFLQWLLRNQYSSYLSSKAVFHRNDLLLCLCYSYIQFIHICIRLAAWNMNRPVMIPTIGKSPRNSYCAHCVQSVCVLHDFSFY